MKHKHLESLLSSLPHRVFPDPKIMLEQYPTSVDLAASIILSALAKGDAGPGKSILDLGCGPGILGLGFALVQSDNVYLVDCDSDALELARENVDMLEEQELIGTGSDEEEEDDDIMCRGVELIHATVKYDPPKKDKQKGGRVGRGGGRGGRGRKARGGGRGNSNSNTSSTSTPQNEQLYSHPSDNNEDDGIPLPSNVVDTVITNPPFGTKNNEGIDVQFLKTAIRLSKKAVYSFHKTSTRTFLLKLLREKWGLNAEVVAEMKFDIPNMYKFHKQKCVNVEVDLLRVWKDDDHVVAVDEENNAEQEDGTDSDKGEEWRDELGEGEELPIGLCGHS